MAFSRWSLNCDTGGVALLRTVDAAGTGRAVELPLLVPMFRRLHVLERLIGAGLRLLEVEREGWMGSDVSAAGSPEFRGDEDEASAASVFRLVVLLYLRGNDDQLAI